MDNIYYLRRALLFTVVEDLLTNFGMDGKACLLRAICEVHGHKSIHKFGFIGEFLQLFFTSALCCHPNTTPDNPANTTDNNRDGARICEAQDKTLLRSPILKLF
ncbi:hypothetical protein QTP88_000945 [Uroleucon formosanum]